MNPFNLNIPQVPFDGGCKKCHGSGCMMTKKGQNVPCRRCYRRQGICRFCYGTQTNFMQNKPCKKCQGGRKGGKKKGHGKKQWGNNNFAVGSGLPVGEGFTSISD